MKITMYELLGMVKDDSVDYKYVKYFDRVNEKDDVMLACAENIIYKLDHSNIELNDIAEILEVETIEEEKKIPEKLILYTLSNNDSADFTTLQDFNNRDIQRTINWILDYLKSKGE